MNFRLRSSDLKKPPKLDNDIQKSVAEFRKNSTWLKLDDMNQKEFESSLMNIFNSTASIIQPVHGSPGGGGDLSDFIINALGRRNIYI